MKYRVIAVVMTALIFSSGCSMLNYEASKTDYVNRVATQRAQASGDVNVVKAVAMGNTVAAGVDLADPAFWAVIKEHPFRATLAAVADVAAGAAATWAITSTIDNSHHDSTSTTINGNNNSMNYNQGQGNVITQQPTTTTTTTNP